MIQIQTVDRLIALFAAGIVLFGSYSWWQTRRRVREGPGMMSDAMTMPGMDPVWYLFGTLIAVSVVLGVYVLSREQLSRALETSAEAGIKESNGAEDAVSTQSSKNASASLDRDGLKSSSRGDSSPLKFLPEDERRVVEPIIESPGLTQVELRGRSNFSKAKVSQTVSELEDRGLVYRERQGRTYRVYPGEILSNDSPTRSDSAE